MFSNHRLLKVAGLCLVFAGILHATPTAAQAQSSRAKSAASYFARGSEWHARGEFDRGYARVAIGDHEGALSDFNRAIKLNPRHASAYDNRGILRFARGDFDGAIADHTRTIELNPRLAESYNNRANARYAKGDYEGALADYNQALAINPRYAEVYANRGVLWLRLKKTSEADADFARCVALKPDMKSSLEQRINQLQAQFQIQIRIPGH